MNTDTLLDRFHAAMDALKPGECLLVPETLIVARGKNGKLRVGHHNICGARWWRTADPHGEVDETYRAFTDWRTQGYLRLRAIDGFEEAIRRPLLVEGVGRVNVTFRRAA